ncbi:retron St85 family RNA-directed DNA polymerase [Escherichia coli]|uniref:retron St85 family RNA-directed DNA polymerase n=1 Tax=Escherichia coli TaxID=562 RepID=UPI000DDEB65F|nr:retron St85 family RNA-directed DNA polymerase [Escherichia coli]EKG6860669.1 retron St85 family RNA-directed DNA polymerase [Escherichia coli]HCJ6069933.1 retron St85 family RNA-directed DNA polymerase [Escherichia coli]HCJ8231336.1 retron St85 family RNA-directed DNA polymerase [Escherichia coli]
MSNSINFRLLLWATSIIQPATSAEILYYLKLVLADDGALPDVESLKQHLKELKKHGYVEIVSVKKELYSLTPAGDEKLSANLRQLRDKLRIFLLDKCYKSTKFGLLASTDTKNTGGESPSLQLRPYIKEVPHPSLPWASGTLPSRPRQAWVRIFEQLRIGSMSSSQASTLSEDSNNHNFGDSFVAAPTFYSYKSLNHPAFENNGVLTIASCIGLTPRLISSMIKNPERYYRVFEIPKKSGGARKISAPRKFMKVTQYWINDYLLNRLKIHSSCFSYRKGTSIHDNAYQHRNNDFIANIDIENYFGSINKTMIKNCLLRNNLSEHIVNTIAGLTTLYGTLPQGAPTSPNISNAILYDFDETMANQAKARGCVYTRYSDDITISGNDRYSVEELVGIAKNKIFSLGFKINESKYRLLSYNNRQLVTGILINGPLRPPRLYRKKVRAIFDQALKSNDCRTSTLNTLKGHLNYLLSFKVYGFEFDEEKYQLIIDKLTKEVH